MSNILIYIIVSVLFTAGQFFIVLGRVMPGYIMVLSSIMAGLFYIFKPWRLFNKNNGVINTGNLIIPVILALSALALSITGTIIVKDLSGLSLLLYVLSGLFLFMAKPAKEKFFDFFEIPENTTPMLKWEPWYVIVLFLVSAFLRFYKLADVPPIAGGNEGLMYGNCMTLASKGMPYMPHIGGGTDWPTFTYYVGIFFAKVFGWELASFRLSSAVFGVISIIAFYFLARRLTSPLSAAITSLMYTVFLVHITTSRFFISPATLLFIPHIICLSILLAANKNPKWYLFLAAGLACGYSLQGYVPGRGVFLLFTGWFLLMLITGNKIFHKISNFFIFWAGFIIVASPVIYFAIWHSAEYWGYVNSVDPSRAGGILAYINRIRVQIPLYTGMFYVRSACEVFWHILYKPLFDPVTEVLFSSGLFLCVFSFWKPVSSVLLILFFGGMIPSLLGGGGSDQPNSLRALMAFPIIFIICAFSFERIKRVFYQSGKKWIYFLTVAAGITASLWSLQEGYRVFLQWSVNPALFANDNHHLYLMGKDIKKYPKAVLHLTPFNISADASGIFIPIGSELHINKYIDEMLVLDRNRDHLICLDPFNSEAAEIFRRYFPNAIISIHREENQSWNDAYFKNLTMNQGYRKHTDEYVPHIFLSTVFIPGHDIYDFQTMLYADISGKDERVKVFGQSDFAEKYAGKKIVLKGAVLVPEELASENSRLKIVFDMKWRGWKMVLDGSARQFGKQLEADGGVHFFELSGRVPYNEKGDLPLTVNREKTDLIKEGRIVAMDGVQGVRVYNTPGTGNWDKPFVYSHRWIYPDMRYYDGPFMSVPFSLRERAMLRVPETGIYDIKAVNGQRFRITIGKKTVYDNLLDPSHITREKITMTKGKPEKFELLMQVEAVPFIDRVLAVYIKGPGMKDFIIAPADWFYPAD